MATVNLRLDVETVFNVCGPSTTHIIHLDIPRKAWRVTVWLHDQRYTTTFTTFRDLNRFFGRYAQAAVWEAGICD